MANLVQLKVLEELDGVLLVDKPAGIACTTVVKAVKRRFNLVKVGHGGSLDAMASGLFGDFGGERADSSYGRVPSSSPAVAANGLRMTDRKSSLHS